MVTTSATFRSWLKASTNMKLSSDASVLRVTHEGLASYDTFVEFDKAAIKNLPRVYKGYFDAIASDISNNVQAEAAVPGANVVPFLSKGSLLPQTPHDTMPQSIGQCMPLVCTMEMSFPP